MATALAAVGALVMSGGLVMLGASTATATDTSGNNGTLKILNATSNAEFVDNEPKVCTFKYEGFYFDAGQQGNVVVAGQGQTEFGPVTVGSVTANSDGYFVTPTQTLASGQYKVEFQSGLDNVKFKSKVFKVNCTPDEVAPVSPTVVQSPRCEVQGTYTIPSTPGVQYLLAGQPISAGTYSGPLSGTAGVVTARALEGFELVSESWSFQINLAPAVPCGGTTDLTVVPSVAWNDPDCADFAPGWTGLVGGLADTASDGVSFSLTSGTVAAGNAVTVTATAAAGYQFNAQGLKTMAFSHTFGAVPTDCVAGVEEIAPEITFTDPNCDNLDGADWSGNLKEIVSYEVTGTPGLGESITVTASIKPALADQYAFPEGFDATVDHTYPTLEELECVLGEETVVPSPKPEQNPPVVLGTEAAVPTQVDAGMASLPGTGSSTNALLAQLLVAGGLILLVAGGWVGFAGRDYGKHHI